MQVAGSQSLSVAERNCLELLENQLRMMGEMLGSSSSVGVEMTDWAGRLRTHLGQDRVAEVRHLHALR